MWEHCHAVVFLPIATAVHWPTRPGVRRATIVVNPSRRPCPRAFLPFHASFSKRRTARAQLVNTSCTQIYSRAHIPVVVAFLPGEKTVCSFEWTPSSRRFHFEFTRRVKAPRCVQTYGRLLFGYDRFRSVADQLNSCYYFHSSTSFSYASVSYHTSVRLDYESGDTARTLGQSVRFARFVLLVSLKSFRLHVFCWLCANRVICTCTCSRRKYNCQYSVFDLVLCRP